MKKDVQSLSKTIKAELTADEVKAAIVKAAGAQKAADAKVEFDLDGGAVVSYSITKTAK